jgi:hypothetical protein
MLFQGCDFGEQGVVCGLERVRKPATQAQFFETSALGLG